jgi:hypothetical protein
VRLHAHGATADDLVLGLDGGVCLRGLSARCLPGLLGQGVGVLVLPDSLLLGHLLELGLLGLLLLVGELHGRVERCG